MDTNKITDPLNRGMVAGILGMPADMVNMLRNAGRSVQNLTLMAQNKPTIPMQQDPAYGQEWWGNKLAQFGYVSPNRNAMAEFAAGLLDPTGIADNLAAKAPMLVQGLFNLGDPSMLSAAGGLLGVTARRGPNKRNNLQASDLQDLISSQKFLDRKIVAQKIKDGIFDVYVTPKFNLDDREVRAITDGHHALEAAIRSGNRPNFIEQTASENDRIGLLNSGNIDDYLRAAYHDSPWYDFATKVDLF